MSNENKIEDVKDVRPVTNLGLYIIMFLSIATLVGMIVNALIK